MKKAFFINGGAGRVLCSVPALEHYMEHTDPDVVIVAEVWMELFLSTKLRNNVYPPSHKDLFQTVLKDRELVSPEPYRLNAYFNQRVNLIQAFDIIINETGEDIPSKPINLDIGKNDQIYGHNLVNSIRQQIKKDKVIVYQPFGSGARMEGNFIWDSSGRSFELKDVFRTVEELSKDYGVILMSQIQIPSEKPMGAAIPDNASLLQWMGIINAADYFLGCDSIGQHYAHALGKPATVVIGSTFPENISYPENENFTIIDNAKEKRTYSPYRITHDPSSERHNEDNMILTDKNYEAMIASVKTALGTPVSNITQPSPFVASQSNSTVSQSRPKLFAGK
jgi:hypothetical protein